MPSLVSAENGGELRERLVERLLGATSIRRLHDEIRDRVEASDAASEPDDPCMLLALTAVSVCKLMPGLFSREERRALGNIWLMTSAPGAPHLRMLRPIGHVDAPAQFGAVRVRASLLRKLSCGVDSIAPEHKARGVADVSTWCGAAAVVAMARAGVPIDVRAVGKCWSLIGKADFVERGDQFLAHMFDGCSEDVR